MAYTHAAVTVGGSNTALLAAPSDNFRTYVLIQNDHATNTLWIKLGAAAVLNEGIRIAAGESYEMSFDKRNLDGAAINGIASGAGTEVLVTTRT